MSGYTVEKITPQTELAEGPFWDVSTQCLYFVDILKSKIFKYVPATQILTFASVGSKTVSFIIPVKGKKDEFFISYGADLATVTWDGKSEKVLNLKILLTADSRATIRINDGKMSPSGAMLFGTMINEPIPSEDQKPQCHLFSYKNGKIKTLLDGISLSNGLAWNKEGNTLYYIDTFKYCINAYNYNSDDTITFQKAVFCFKEKNISGFPDGMSIDTQGFLWVANFGDSKVLKIDPKTSEILMSISLPSTDITSVTFGGPNLDELYVTSACFRKSQKEREENTNLGCCFRITGFGAFGYPDIPISL